MRKYFKVLVLTLLVLSVASWAFAGVTRVNHGGVGANITVALETLGAARNVTLTGAGGFTLANANTVAPVSFQLGAALSTANLLSVEFTNGASLTGATVNVCAFNGAGGVNGVIKVGGIMPTAGTTTQNISFLSIPVTANVAMGETIWLTTSTAGDGCENGAVAATAANSVFAVNIATTTTTPTIRITQRAQGEVLDPSTAVIVASLIREFTPIGNSTTHTIDYLEANAVGNKLINATGVAANSIADSQQATAGVNVVGVTRTAPGYAVNGLAGAAALQARATVVLTDPDQQWAGINRVWLNTQTTNCNTAFPGVVGANATSAGPITLSIPSANFNENTVAGNGFNLCVQTTGATLSTRTIKSQTSVVITGTGAGAGQVGAVSNAQVWGINGYQAIIPFQQLLAGRETYCLINNGNLTGPANVLLEATSSETNAVVTSRSIGTVAASGSILMTMDNVGVKLGTGAVTNLATTLGAGNRYAAKLTITASPVNVSIACIQTDGAIKRAVPVLTADGAGNPFKQ